MSGRTLIHAFPDGRICSYVPIKHLSNLLRGKVKLKSEYKQTEQKAYQEPRETERPEHLEYLEQSAGGI